MAKSKDDLKGLSKKVGTKKLVEANYTEKKEPTKEKNLKKVDSSKKKERTNQEKKSKSKVSSTKKTKKEENLEITRSKNNKKVESKIDSKDDLSSQEDFSSQTIASDKASLEVETDSIPQKAYAFPRVLAFVIDFMIVTLLSSFVLSIVPQNKNYAVYLEEYQKIQADFLARDIDPEEYVNKSVDVIYDIDYSNVLPMIVEVVILILYYIVFQFYNKGQTIGKKLLKIRILSSDYKEVTMNQLIVRSLVVPAIASKMLIIAMVLFMGKNIYYYASFTVQGIQMAVFIISIFMIMYSKTGRGIHDRLAKTTVIMTN